MPYPHFHLTLIRLIMVDVQTVLEVVPALGVIVALLYYSLTIRNTEKLRRKDFIFQNSNLWLKPEYFDAWYKIQDLSARMWDYGNLDEFFEKFNKEQRKTFDWVLSIFNVIAITYWSGVGSEDELFQLTPPNFTINMFEMSWPYIRDLRVQFGDPEYLKPFERLYYESRRRNPDYVPRWRKGLSPTREIHP